MAGSESRGTPEGQSAESLDNEQLQALLRRVGRLERRREQLGPVNPLAGDEYAEAVAHVEEMEARREDLETALRELRGIIRDTDRQIEETFNETFQAAARNFEDLVEDVFPGGSGRLRLVSEEQVPRKVLGGQDRAGGEKAPGRGGTRPMMRSRPRSEVSQDARSWVSSAWRSRSRRRQVGQRLRFSRAGRVDDCPGSRSLFLARPCPFYILDEVEAGSMTSTWTASLRSCAVLRSRRVHRHDP